MSYGGRRNRNTALLPGAVEQVPGVIVMMTRKTESLGPELQDPYQGGFLLLFLQV